MTGLERLILDLVQVGEAPLYSTYRWLGRQLGRDVSLSEFLKAIAAAVERDALRLWSVDVSTGDRTELFGVPADLERRYVAEPLLDARYDPFGISLTLGGAAEAEAEPAWEFMVDFDNRMFEIKAVAGREDEALDQLSRCYPDLHPVVTARGDHGEVRRLVGTLRHESRS
ncbi:MAG: hypothetical protein KJ056_12290 [Acidimicrobiia bacterium]|nr:hypothetical protein [Acidimicrobiia bacterium]